MKRSDKAAELGVKELRVHMGLFDYVVQFVVGDFHLALHYGRIVHPRLDESGLSQAVASYPIRLTGNLRVTPIELCDSIEHPRFKLLQESRSVIQGHRRQERLFEWRVIEADERPGKVVEIALRVKFKRVS